MEHASVHVLFIAQPEFSVRYGEGLSVTGLVLVFVKVPVECMSMLMSFQWCVFVCVCGTLVTVIYSFVAWHLDSKSG